MTTSGISIDRIGGRRFRSHLCLTLSAGLLIGGCTRPAAPIPVPGPASETSLENRATALLRDWHDHEQVQLQQRLGGLGVSPGSPTPRWSDLSHNAPVKPVRFAAFEGDLTARTGLSGWDDLVGRLDRLRSTLDSARAVGGRAVPNPDAVLARIEALQGDDSAAARLDEAREAVRGFDAAVATHEEARSRLVDQVAPIFETFAPVAEMVERWKSGEDPAILDALAGPDSPLGPVYDSLAGLNDPGSSFANDCASLGVAYGAMRDRLAPMRQALESAATAMGDSSLREAADSFGASAERYADESGDVDVELQVILAGVGITVATFSVSPLVAIVVAAVVVLAIVLFLIFGDGGPEGRPSGETGPVALSVAGSAEGPRPGDGAGESADEGSISTSADADTEDVLPVQIENLGPHHAAAYQIKDRLVLDVLLDGRPDRREMLVLKLAEHPTLTAPLKAGTATIKAIEPTREGDRTGFPIRVELSHVRADDQNVVVTFHSNDQTSE